MGADRGTRDVQDNIFATLTGRCRSDRACTAVSRPSARFEMSTDFGPLPHAFLNLEELEDLAKHKLTKMAYDYYAGGANTQQSVRDNRTSYANYRLLPQILVDVSCVDTSCTMFGKVIGPLCAGLRLPQQAPDLSCLPAAPA